ncbi:MAG: hypothetical protein A2653_00240 [Candidatus Zambryskibacteria bacterium RIFCSPHIGHO2_01_FULL_43_25]|uniref:Aspartyl/glutamyl-tRNA(Asn/Gln) amidotransferase subunit C n=1 Tax=Candidatus Zambryskibacteria bacterium RIFCSPLOWO2_01_FULL_45_21 TaxID=1802761 RepID=A0A1G2U4P1_9BACT|nr:MAG: hypothetical protein A2653_00240 [Candidatus Zambryskibacteria bacterium RIFCSPHIGHO2_01_FULL_43_25]OHB00663.1 MAG: hypothetical protein A3E94_03495 [Candidatus Zambryskibacteria bacterium RIFCSPHIGHO2_12_FULL_44_12b]OHB04478.1 MAG: hypothetical protein A3B14_03535 [Candidatus Zambryskibacteria bacterium RIFCSPLOWO2_01_FULL_45_21]
MIEREEIKKLASLSRIKLNDDEVGQFQKEIESILAFVAKVREAAGSASKAASGEPDINVLREDKMPHEGGIFTESLLSQAPKTEKNYVKVKKILQND